MKIIYSSKYERHYNTNPVENPERVSIPALELKTEGYDFIEPSPASLKDVHRVHSLEHIEIVKHRGLFEAASLAAGGAICAAEMAMQGEPTFALIRPPGHHASANRAWGTCFFNNIAIAIQKIRQNDESVLIIDIDLHFGDGTVSIFRGIGKVEIVNPGAIDKEFSYLSMGADDYLEQVNRAFDGSEYDIVGVSAGFDTYVDDWGGLLRTDDYEEIGRIIAKGSERCGARRFAVLEGGYHPDLKHNITSFIRGFE